MTKRFILITILLLFLINSAYAEKHSGKKLYQYGSSAVSLGRGGTGITTYGTDFLYTNPASIATAERIGLSLQYGTLSGAFYNPDISMSIPTQYGVVGLGFKMINLPDTYDLKTGYSFTIGGAKDVTSRFMLGASIHFFYGSDGGDLFYTGATFGTIYKFKNSKKKKGFGFVDPKIGLSINAGVPIGDNKSYVQFNTLTLGYSFIFFSVHNFNLGFFNELSMINLYRNFPVKFGFESVIINRIILRVGFVYPQAYDYGDFSCGAGYKLEVGNFKGSLNYAFNMYKDKKYTHYIGLNMEFGRLDRMPPEIEISIDNKYISPNHDGRKDYVIFNLDVRDESRLKGWKLQIQGPDKKVVKEFKMSERDIIRGLSGKEFFRRLFGKKASYDVPDKIMWDGTDTDSNIVNNGKYTYSFTAWDERDNIAALKTGIIIVDNASPEIKLRAKENLFSPNNDKSKDTFIIKQKVKTSPDDEWVAGFKDSQNNIVKSYKWTGNNIPATVVWNGKDDNGKDAPEGLYYYYIKTEDKAGNRANAEIKEISLTRKYEVADLTVSSEYFSFNNRKDVKLFTKLSKTYGLKNWKVEVFDENNKLVKEITGNKKFKKLIVWDGKDNKNKELKDGIYFLKLSTEFKSGNRPESFLKRIVFDSTPPDVKVSHKPDMFSPDGDGENDLLIINASAKDDSGISNWKINIYEPSGAVFKSFSGKGDPPKEIIWDGIGDDKDIVESAADYFIELEAVDPAGNISKCRDRAKVDILVVVTERGLKMRISNIEFGFGSAMLKKKGSKILNRVANILKKYENYDIVIEGHTDDIGKEDYNLSLSEERASSVYDYLIKKGIDKDRLEFIGMGETVPLYPNTDDENRRRNRRVEFLLIKKGE